MKACNAGVSNNLMKNEARRAAAILGFLAALAIPAEGLDWPQWRGPDRTDVSKETGLLKKWPADGPQRIWLFENAGSGYSGPAIVQGRLYTLGTRDDNEIILALDANTGKELWVSKIGGVLRNGYGNGPRGTPTVDGDRIYAMSGKGDLVCASLADGKVLWQASMLDSDLGGKRPGWGYTESVLVEGGRVFCTPGGTKGALAAFDKVTGKKAWQSSEFLDPAHYSSIIPADLNGARQLIQRTEKSIAGINASDGKLLWKTEFPGRVAVIPTPIYREGNVYVTAGYGAGCKMVKVEAGNQVKVVYENRVMVNHHGGVVLVGDYLYGHSDSGGWVCQNFKTGAQVWAAKKLGKGAVSCADGMLYCLEEGSGTVALVEASPAEWKEHGRLKLSPQTKIRSDQGAIWTHPVISNGKLYLRDQDLIYCYKISN